MAQEPRAVLLVITAGSRDEAERLGEGAVEAGLAACGSVIPGVHSFYRWEGRIQRAHEAILLVKTSAGRAEEAQAYIRDHHSYDVPEIIAINVDGGSDSYLEWLMKEVESGPARGVAEP
jgi:periplasmic divalent cation tolerance protein